MADEKIALRTPLEKGSDTTFLREMIGFAAQRLMELESEALCGAGHERSGAAQSAQPPPPPRLGQMAPAADAEGAARGSGRRRDGTGRDRAGTGAPAGSMPSGASGVFRD